MKKPKPGTLLQSKEFWNNIDELRAESGKLPDEISSWTMNFIGIHHHNYGNGMDVWSMSSPLCLVDMATGIRPEWEQLKFKSFEEALIKAKEEAMKHDLFILDCGKIMPDDR